MNKINKIDKYIGTLLGGCCGDVLGSQTEGMTRLEIEKKFPNGVCNLPTEKKYTDDTEMTIILARYIVQNSRIDNPAHLHCDYGKISFKRGYSQQTRLRLQHFSSLKRGDLVFLNPGERDTNGSVMRIAPIGLLNGIQNDTELYEEINKAVYFTHGTINKEHTDSIHTCMLHCKLINYLVNNETPTKYELFSKLMEWTSILDPKIFSKINLVKYCLNSKSKKNINFELFGQENFFQIKAIDAFCCAIYTFFKFYDKPKDALIYAASLGGDTDTIAKLVGDLCGALHGINWIPKEWNGVEDQEEIINLGRALYNTKYKLSPIKK